MRQSMAKAAKEELNHGKITSSDVRTLPTKMFE